MGKHSKSIEHGYFNTTFSVACVLQLGDLPLGTVIDERAGFEASTVRCVGRRGAAQVAMAALELAEARVDADSMSQMADIAKGDWV